MTLSLLFALGVTGLLAQVRKGGEGAAQLSGASSSPLWKKSLCGVAKIMLFIICHVKLRSFAHPYGSPTPKVLLGTATKVVACIHGL